MSPAAKRKLFASVKSEFGSDDENSGDEPPNHQSVKRDQGGIFLLAHQKLIMILLLKFPKMKRRKSLFI